MSSWNRGGVIDIVPRARIQVERSRALVSAEMRGGLGNRIFEVMAGLGYAERTGKQFVFYEEHITHNPHADPRSTKELLLALFPFIKVYRGKLNWKKHVEEHDKHYFYNPIPDMSGSVVLHGYFQNVGYFAEGAREKFIVPRSKETRFDSSGVDWAHTYFVHFRFGDYVGSDFELDLSEYYKTAVGLVMTMDPEATFLLFSDQPSKINFDRVGLSGLRYIVVPVKVGMWETLWLMSRCRGAICANSSFSWFGAFAVRGDGPIFMPARWSKNHVATPNPPWAIGI